MILSTRTSRRRGMIAVLAATLAFGLVSCAEESTPTPTASATSTETAPDPSVDPSATATATPDGKVNPEGSAADNLAVFTKAVNDVWAGPRKVEGLAYIDALVSAGFTEKSKMQVTDDYMGIGEPAESILFSVLWRGECLIGQVGPETGSTPVTMVAPVLGSGRCLPGQTAEIGP